MKIVCKWHTEYSTWDFPCLTRTPDNRNLHKPMDKRNPPITKKSRTNSHSDLSFNFGLKFNSLIMFPEMISISSRPPILLIAAFLLASTCMTVTEADTCTNCKVAGNSWWWWQWWLWSRLYFFYSFYCVGKWGAMEMLKYMWQMFVVVLFILILWRRRRTLEMMIFMWQALVAALRDELISDCSIRVQQEVKYFNFCHNEDPTIPM